MISVGGKDRGRAAVVIFYMEQITDVRRQMRGVLGQAGFGTVEELASTDDLLAAFGRVTPDLLLLDCGMPGVTDLIRDIRFGRAGPDPFLPIIATIWSPTAEDAQAIARGGPDDVLIKPMAPNALLERIGTLIHSRKKFVFTEAYIGPDRRNDPIRRKEGPNVRPVPNRLAAKITGRPIDEAEYAALRTMIPTGGQKSAPGRDREDMTEAPAAP